MFCLFCVAAYEHKYQKLDVIFQTSGSEISAKVTVKHYVILLK